MTTKEAMLTRIREALVDREKVDYPKIGTFANPDADVLAIFKESLKPAGATWHEVNSVEEAQKIMAKQLPDAKVICSATPEWKGNKDLKDVKHPQDLHDVDLGVIRAEFGVAENGAVWMTQDDLGVNSLGFLSQHLAILLDPSEVVENMHLAYPRVKIPEHPYGTFMMGPSATGDVEAVLVHGAQGSRTLTLFFLADPKSS